MRAIGLDLGTTSICGILMDAQTGAVLRSRTEASHAFIAGKHPWESLQSPERIIALAMDILEDLWCADVCAIGVTGQMHGIVYTDRTGKAVSPLYTWQDGRGHQPYQGSTYAEHLHSHSGYGHVTHLYNTVNGLVPAQADGFCTIHDYLVMQLCGLKKAQIHISSAASFGCFDLQKRAFTCQCDAHVVRGFRVAGEYRGVPVGVGIGDNQASVFSCLASPDDALLNIGTGSQISVVSDSIIEGDGIETRPYLDDDYLLVGAALCGGRAYAVLKDFYARVLGYAADLTDDQVYAIMDRMLEGVDGSELRVDTRFEGTRADQSLRGSISGLSTANFTPENLTCGVLEGMVAELLGMYRAMQAHCGRLIASGNGVRRNPALQRIAQRMFGMPLRIPAHKEEAAFGAALYALIASGRCQSAAEAQQLIRFESKNIQ